MKSISAFRILACAALLAAAAAQAQTGAACSAQPPASYGDAPRPATSTLSGLLASSSFCASQGGKPMNWIDGHGLARRACLLTPANVSPVTRLPLLVWLHPSLYSESDVQLTGLIQQMSTADLSGDPARRGFALLLPTGRDTEHFYPAPDDKGLGWDNWYRNFNRGTPGLNVDAAALDHFIAVAKTLIAVDPRRVYLSGWSNGAAMAELYALNTPGIAAVAVYSAPDPYRDVADPCGQLPFARNLTPLMDVHNACDIFGTCPTAKKFHDDLAKRYPAIRQNALTIDTSYKTVSACDASCNAQTGGGGSLSRGAINHSRWPQPLNPAFFQFLREHPLP